MLGNAFSLHIEQNVLAVFMHDALRKTSTTVLIKGSETIY